jgi:hypothetical protein
MASGKGNTAKNVALDYMLGGGVSYATLWLALYTVAPTSAGGGTEVTGGSYARLSLTNNATNFPAASGGSKSNGVIFTMPTATADWGTVVAAALHNHATADQVVYFGTLTANRSVPNGAIADFPIGTLVFTEA